MQGQKVAKYTADFPVKPMLWALREKRPLWMTCSLVTCVWPRLTHALERADDLHKLPLSGGYAQNCWRRTRAHVLCHCVPSHCAPVHGGGHHNDGLGPGCAHGTRVPCCVNGGCASASRLFHVPVLFPVTVTCAHYFLRDCCKTSTNNINVLHYKCHICSNRQVGAGQRKKKAK